jgi:hypothetical protein
MSQGQESAAHPNGETPAPTTRPTIKE